MARLGTQKPPAPNPREPGTLITATHMRDFVFLVTSPDRAVNLETGDIHNTEAWTKSALPTGTTIELTQE